MVFFGISSITALFGAIDECLQQKWWEILPRGGIRHTALRILHQMDPGFYGVLLPHLGVECSVAQMKKLLTHYGNKSGIGIFMQMPMELLVTELGASLQPMAMPYPQYQAQVTHCWIKSCWEKAHLFEV
jgi:hypothetical protein